MLTKNEIAVRDRYNSHLHCDLETVAEALSNIEVSGDFGIYQYTSQRTGPCYCVEVTDEDQVFYQTRPRRKGPSKMVLNREPEQVNTLVLVLMRAEDIYVLITAYWGTKGEPEPWDELAFRKDPRGYEVAKAASEDWWKNRALIPH